LDPITRAYIDLEFADATGKVAMLPRNTTDQALDPYEDSSPPRAILEWVYLTCPVFSSNSLITATVNSGSS
jgi:hypothetical protein